LQRCALDTLHHLRWSALYRALQGKCEARLGSEKFPLYAAIAKGLQEAAAFDPFADHGM